MWHKVNNGKAKNQWTHKLQASVSQTQFSLPLASHLNSFRDTAAPLGLKILSAKTELQNMGRLKMWDRKMRNGQKCRGGKCRTGKCGTNMQRWKMRDDRVWKACLRISVSKLMLECKNENGFSSFDTVMSNSCTICFAYTNVFCVSALYCIYIWTCFSQFYRT